MRYQPLFELQVEHAGYPGGRCKDVHIEVRDDHPSGARALARHRLLARQLGQGLRIVANVTNVAKQDDEHRLMLQPLAELTLGFEVHAQAAELAATTDLSSWAGLQTPLYRNVDGRLQLVGDAQVKARPGVVALIEIAGIDSPSWLAAPPSFTLALEPRATLWVYYLLTQRPASEAPRIEDGEGKRPIQFTRKQLSASNTSASSDPTGARLLQRNPEHRCWRLVSKKPIPWQQAARRQLSLYLGDELLIRELATPALSHSTILALSRAKPRESLYRVVMY